MGDPMKIRARLEGDTADVRVLMAHPMETGQRKDPSGKVIPLHFIKEIRAELNGKLVWEAQISQAVSRNPVFAFKVKGAKQHVIADVTLFVNGIPLAVLECKNPTLGDKWLHDATEQFDRYQELSERYRGLGAQRLFNTVQVLVATCGQGARIGTVGSSHRHFAEWKVRDAASVAELEHLIGRPP